MFLSNSVLINLRYNLDGLDIDVGTTPGMLEAHGVGAIPQVGTVPGGLPGQGRTGSDDGVQIDVVDVDIDRAEVGVFGEGQRELRTCESDLSRVTLGAGEVHRIVGRTGTGVSEPVAAEDPGGVGVIVRATTHWDYWSEDLDGIDVDESAATGMLETHGVGAIPQVGTGPGGLPDQGGACSGDGIQVDVVDEDIDRTEIGVPGEGQGEA